MDSENDSENLFPNTSGSNPAGTPPHKDEKGGSLPELSSEGGDKPRPMSLNKFVKKKDAPSEKPAQDTANPLSDGMKPQPEKTEAKGPVKLNQSQVKAPSDKPVPNEPASDRQSPTPQPRKESAAKPELRHEKAAPDPWPQQQRPHSGQPKSLSSSSASAGHILQEARVHSGLSIEQVSVRTKIKKDYLLALERDDFPSLPAPVFITAYIKSLCDLYGIRENEGDILQKIDRKDGGRRVPGEIIQQVQEGRQVNVEEEEKVRKVFMTTITATIILIAVGIAALTYLATTKYRSAPAGEATAKKTDNYKFFCGKIEEKFMVPQPITMDELPVIEKAHGAK